MTTISSVNRASETRRARRAVPLITCTLFRDPSGTYVPTPDTPRSRAPTLPRSPHPTLTPTSPRPRTPRPNLTPIRPHPRPALALHTPASHSPPRLHAPHPGFTLPTQNSACNSITLDFNIPRKRCNSNDHNSIFEIDPGELHARLLGNHDTTTVDTTPSTPPPRSAEAATGEPGHGLVKNVERIRRGRAVSSRAPGPSTTRPGRACRPRWSAESG